MTDRRWLAVVALLGACGGKKDRPAGDTSGRPDDAAVTIVMADAALGDAARAPADVAPTSASPDVTSKVLQVAVRGRVACARRTDGRVRCWGRQWDGTAAPVAAAPVELPGITNAVGLDITPKGVLYVVTSDGHVRRSFAELTKLAPLEDLELEGEAIDVRALDDVPYVLTRAGDAFGPQKSNPRLRDIIALHTLGGRGLALHRDGHVTAFTADKAAVLPGLTDLETLIGFGCGRRRGGELVCWDARGKVSPWRGPANIIERVAGDHFSCDLTSSGVACTGWNEVGQLGTGSEADRTTPRLVELPGKPNAVAAGDRSVCAVLDTGEVACWGGNDGGQLGDGTLLDRPRPVVLAGVTSHDPPPPSDGLRSVQQASDEMSWTDLPDGCKRPARLAGPEGHELATVVSAYAYPSGTGAELWFADFRLEPAGYRSGTRPARAGQHAFELRLARQGALDRGRYQGSGPRRASLVVHDQTGSVTFTRGLDLVVERVDKTWICGQLLDPDPAKRQPFAARIAKRR